MRVELTKKTQAALKKITDHGKEIGGPAEIIEFAVDRFLRRRQSIKKWQDEHAKPKKKGKKTKAKKAGVRRAAHAKRKPAVKPKRASKPRVRKAPTVSAPPSVESQAAE